MTRNDTIPPDFKKCIDTATDLRLQLKFSDINSKIATICSVYNSESIILKTIQELLEQSKRVGHTLDFFVILNRGGGNTVNVFPPMDKSKGVLATYEKLRKKLGFDEIIQATINEKGKLLLKEKLKTEESKNRLFVIHQHNSPLRAGKAVALGDLFRYFLGTVSKTYQPKYLYMVDAETRLRVIPEGKSRFNPEIKTPDGLKEMINSVQPGQVVGSRFLFLKYSDKGEPRWGESIPPLQHSINLMIGTPTLNVANGGSLIGYYADFMPVYCSMFKVYPRTSNEDSLALTILYAMNYQFKLLNQVIHTNLCPDSDIDAYNQFVRWKLANKCLREEVGIKMSRRLHKGNLYYMLFTIGSIFRWPGYERIGRIFQAFTLSSAIDITIEKEKHDWQNGDASW
ncbi:MAG: hypothetical protein ABUK01_04675 [Leptospirales bacterium]